MRWSLRSWSTKDEAHLDSLLSADVDPLWREQFHGLHGPDRDGTDWRRTRVAVDDHDRMVGCASIVHNPLHPGRFPCAVEVVPAWRRRGIGTALLDTVKELRANVSHPLSTKVRASDSAATAFLTSQGGLVYQRCPAAVLDAHDPSVQRWINAQPSIGCTDLTNLSARQLSAAFSTQYLWTHRSWSPVGDLDALAAAAKVDMADLDRALSAAAWHDGRLAAVAFAFRAPTQIEVVAETLDEAEPDGEHRLAQAVAFMLRAVRRQQHCHVVAVDGHVTDPHLQPVLDSIPTLTTNPLHLIEIPG
uniref:GNAT family N-acetyltransferase n=1 Tax=Mycolicibacterium llatzerense TaxID=280871 RepID=UPI0013A6F8BB